MTVERPVRNLFVLVLALACAPQTDIDLDPQPAALCDEPRALACEDALVLKLSLHGDKVSEGAVANTLADGVFVTTVDATAGGFGQSQNNPWVYVRFTEQGAERVDIDDETALTDMTWHIAAKRFLLRLNGGSSGPACVGAAPFLERTFEDLTSVPAGLRFQQDDFLTQDCEIINDSSGLPDSPQVALSAWWRYPGCVATTDVPFLIQLPDGAVIRFIVDRYYGQDQQVCNEQDQPGSLGANFTWRWSFVP
jgi:hypothetical protein